MPVLHVAFFVAMFLFVSHLQVAVHGYLDPGTGSIAIQFILDGFVMTLGGVEDVGPDQSVRRSQIGRTDATSRR